MLGIKDAADGLVLYVLLALAAKQLRETAALSNGQTRARVPIAP